MAQPVRVDNSGSPSSPFPDGTTVLVFSNTQANATATAFINSSPGRLAYLSQVMVYGLGATAAAQVLISVFNLAAGALSLPVSVPAGVAAPLAPVIYTFPQPLQASGVNTNIQVNLGAFGGGNTQATLTLFGFLI